MAITGAITHSSDGPKWTVNQLIKNPVWVPNIIQKMVLDNNIAEWLLRTGPTAVGGAVAFEEAVALYAGSEGEIVAEFAEYPMTDTPMRTPMTRATTKRGVGFRISEEMKTRNDVGRVQDEMKMVRDTLVNGRDKVFFNAVMNNTNVQTFAAANAAAADGWYDTNPANSRIRYDITRAVFRIAAQGVPSAANEEKLGYDADTLIVHPQVAAMLFNSPEVEKTFDQRAPASDTIKFSGLLANKFLNLDVFKSWRCPRDTAVVCQRNSMGFISKEWPLRGTPLKFNESDDTYTSYFRYRDLVAIDNPKAVCKITNIDGSSNVDYLI